MERLPADRDCAANFEVVAIGVRRRQDGGIRGAAAREVMPAGDLAGSDRTEIGLGLVNARDRAAVEVDVVWPGGATAADRAAAKSPTAEALPGRSARRLRLGLGYDSGDVGVREGQCSGRRGNAGKGGERLSI